MSSRGTHSITQDRRQELCIDQFVVTASVVVGMTSIIDSKFANQLKKKTSRNDLLSSITVVKVGDICRLIGGNVGLVRRRAAAPELNGVRGLIP